MPKKIIAYTLLFIFSFQVLPVKELGQLIFKGTMNEEVLSNGLTVVKDNKANIVPNPHSSYPTHLIAAEWLEPLLNRSEDLPSSFVGDIFSPPPNLS